MEAYAQAIQKHMEGLPPQVLASLEAISVRTHYKKNHYLLEYGGICRHSFWIERGIVRKFYVSDGNEQTTDFYFPNDLAFSLQSYLSQAPALESLQALTDVEVTRIARADFERAKTAHPELLQLDLMLTEWYAVWLESRLWQLRTLDARARYERLLSEQPHYIRHIPLASLASYIGVSPETLSRIRRRLAEHI